MLLNECEILNGDNEPVRAELTYNKHVSPKPCWQPLTMLRLSTQTEMPHLYQRILSKQKTSAQNPISTDSTKPVAEEICIFEGGWINMQIPEKGARTYFFSSFCFFRIICISTFRLYVLTHTFEHDHCYWIWFSDWLKRIEAEFDLIHNIQYCCINMELREFYITFLHFVHLSLQEGLWGILNI